MQCKTHPTVPAVDRCTGCAETFCSDCLVELNGQKYCAACKTMAIKGPPAMAEEATIPCKEAGEALMYSIFGLFCFGIIVEPIALSKANKAKKMIEMNPRLTGSGKATAAQIIAVIGLIFWIIGLIVRVTDATKK